MTKQTEAMKLALEALVKALPDMPVHTDWHFEAITALREALAEQPAQQEPVAYIKTWHENGEQHVDIWQWEVGIEALKDGNHYLYTSPPAQRKPLTDEQIIQVANETYGPTSEWEVEQIRLDFARAIEAAHGIKENT